MNICVGGFGYLVVDYVFDIFDVNSSGSHISGYEHDIVTRHESVYCFQPCSLLHVRMETNLVHDKLCVATANRKHNTHRLETMIKGTWSSLREF
jgi:hypothetical protein